MTGCWKKTGALGINPIAGAAGVNIFGASSGDDFFGFWK